MKKNLLCALALIVAFGFFVVNVSAEFEYNTCSKLATQKKSKDDCVKCGHIYYWNFETEQCEAFVERQSDTYYKDTEGCFGGRKVSSYNQSECYNCTGLGAVWSYKQECIVAKINNCASQAKDRSSCHKCGLAYVWDVGASICRYMDNEEASICSKNARNSEDCTRCGNRYYWDNNTKLCTQVVYGNYESNDIVNCGTLGEIPGFIPKTVSIIYNLIQVAVPIVLVVFGMMDLFKGITSQKEDEMKKGQQIFVKRLISGVLIFFLFMVVKIVISVVADSSGNDIMECAECLIKNDC